MTEVVSRADRRGQKGEGIAVLEGWLADHPDDRAALGMLAMTYQTEGRDAEAIGAYERLAQSGEPNLIVLNNLAWLYQKAGDVRALETARKAYDLDPNRAEVADTYGWILVQQGMAQEGLTILQQAYVSYPTHAEIGYHVAVALSKTGRNDESVRLLRRLLKESADFEQAAEARALLAELAP